MKPGRTKFLMQRGGIAAATLAVMLAAAISGCATKDRSEKVAPMTTGDENASARSFAMLVKRVCIENVQDTASVERSLAATGWAFVHSQKSDPKNPLSLDIWDGGDARVIVGTVTKDVRICTVAGLGGHSISRPTLEAELVKIAGHRADTHGEWWWKPGSFRKAHMDFSATTMGAKGETIPSSPAVTVEMYRLPLLAAILG